MNRTGRSHAVVLGGEHGRPAGRAGARRPLRPRDRGRPRPAATHAPGPGRACRTGGTCTACTRAAGRSSTSCSTGLTDELLAAGAVSGDVLDQTRFLLSGHRFRQAPSGLRGVLCSRPFLEGHVRARVRALPQVRFLQAAITGLTSSAGPEADHRRADRTEPLPGAHHRDRPGRRRDRARLAHPAAGWPSWATSGRPRTGWRSASATPPGPSGCAPDALGRRRAGDQRRHPGPTPAPGCSPRRRAGGTSSRCPASSATTRRPTGPASAAFADSLAFPDIADALVGAEALDDGVAFRFPASVRRRYERSGRVPAAGCW